MADYLMIFFRQLQTGTEEHKIQRNPMKLQPNPGRQLPMFAEYRMLKKIKNVNYNMKKKHDGELRINFFCETP